MARHVLILLLHLATVSARDLDLLDRGEEGEELEGGVDEGCGGGELKEEVEQESERGELKGE